MVEYKDLPTSEEYRNQRNRIGIISGIICFLFFIVISFFLAPLGFSPTDDGYILSMGSKVFNGEIPHKDFISIRPIGSSLISLYSFLPFVNEYQLLSTRIVCTAELLLIVWFWLQIVARFYKISHSTFLVVATTIVATTITIHDFPFMAWHTIDGVFFCSLALFIRSKSIVTPSQWNVVFTYLLMGMSVLCKQSFAPMIIAILIVFQDYKKPVAYVGIALFPLFYVAWISFNGGLLDLVSQLTAQSKILGVGFKRYLIDLWFIGGTMCGGLLWYLSKKVSTNTFFSSKVALFITLVSCLLLDLIFGENLSKSSVLLFGVMSILSLQSLIAQRSHSIILTVVTALAWSSALSIGYSFPSLLSGAMLVVLFFEFGIEKSINNRTNWKYITALSIVGALFIVGFINARTTKIYREATANSLTYPLGDVLTNGKGIVTNKTTYSFLNDATMIRRKYSTASIIFAPYLAGIYASSHTPHPTISTWSRDLELPNDVLKQRFENNLNVLSSKGSFFAISKYRVEQLATQLTLLNQNTSDSPVVHFAKNNLRLVDSTRFFYIYSK
jgi:hypothetical protein